MGESISVILKKASWLRRVLCVQLPEGEQQIEYSSRSLSHERLLVNGQVEIEKRISTWFRPVFRFFAGTRQATIAVRVSPWLTIRSFHLLIDGQVLYCDRRRDLFEGSEPQRFAYSGADRSLIVSGEPKDPLCPYCDRLVRGVGVDLTPLPVEWTRTDGAIGRPTAVFAFARQQRLTLMVAGILATLAGIALFAASWFLPGANGPAGAGLHHLYLFGFLLVSVGPVAVFFALKNRRLSAVAGSKGVGLIENDAVSSCRWEDIESIHETLMAGEVHSALRASVRGEDHFFRVKCRNGTELVFRNFLDDLVGLGKILKHETLAYLLPPAVAALENGETLDFGPFVLDAEGLRVSEDKRLDWDEVDEVKIAKGLVTVTRVGKRWNWFKSPLGRVPNAHVLLALVRHCCERGFCDDTGGMAGV